jgi:hypothetical protein
MYILRSDTKFKDQILQEQFMLWILSLLTNG